MQISDLLQGCPNNSDMVTNLTTQDCNNIVISVMTVAVLLKQPYNKSDSSTKLVTSFVK